MKNKITIILAIFAVYNTALFAQDGDWADEKKDWADKESSSSSKFFAGINVGALLVNSNTAFIYTGASDITPYGINYLLSVPTYKTTFDTYFQHPYFVSEYPQNPSYKTALDIGLHAGVNLGEGNAIYIDINSATLNYEQTFTMAIDDPNNQSPEPTYEQIPIIGKEKRFNLNLGTQLSLFHAEKSNFYWSFFGNFNSIKLNRNYIVIDNKEYEIIHSNAQLTTPEPGGIGYGGGSGLGFKYKLTNKITADLTYNLYYIKSKMNNAIQGFGMNHGIMFRLIWN
ncbi:MAG: hypothetical protein A3K10_09980 [Bacteroidetes bacterium RIFCSPLOWO2_12_FULL_31_6]|nr:MAG: hypothetical protein A3K10_09980 [Bacteroidetes bacterium RIFCSPLOWO2_12_FULL_31_6]